jgi:hypothetical protein
MDAIRNRHKTFRAYLKNTGQRISAISARMAVAEKTGCPVGMRGKQGLSRRGHSGHGLGRCLWWLNACKIVYTVDECRPVSRLGFADGTLPGHVESGEGRLLIKWDRGTDCVWYRILAFSRPSHALNSVGTLRDFFARLACSTVQVRVRHRPFFGSRIIKKTLRETGRLIKALLAAVAARAA